MALTSEQIKRLDALESRARFIIRPAGDPGGKPLTKDGPERPHLCELIDKVHLKVWATGRGVDEDAALNDALDHAQPRDRPKTTPELITENQQLRERLAELEGDDEPKAKPKRGRKPKNESADPPPAAPPASAPDPD